MAGNRLTGSDKRALALWILGGLLGAAFAQKYFFQAFPEASVNFQVSRQQALARARNFVTGLGENVGGYDSTIVFDVDDDAKVYLERQVGLKEANRLMSSGLNIWFWEVRFFKPQQEEEFKVSVTPAGQIAGYEHIIEKARAGASLERGPAQSIAENFLVAKLGLEPKAWDLLSEEANSEKRPNRIDWSFTWEKHGFRAKDAVYRLKIVVQGDRIGSSKEFLRVPETWERSYAQLRSHNDFLTVVTIVPYVLLLGAALWMGIKLTRQGQATWGTAIKLGIVVAAVLTLMQLNEWPIDRANYDTNSTYGSFVFEQIAGALLFGLASAVTVSLVYPAGESIYRATQPERLQLGKAFTLRGLRSQEFFSAAIVGLSMTGLSLGFVVAFYMVGSRYGVWAPQDLDYTNSVSTVFPWIEGVAVGLLAATNEEFTFRMFAIPFIERITGSRWLAVILPAFCWSFLHTNYPQEPPYIRGVEVGIMGLATGLVMLRWGIVATLIWHYTFDAAQVGLLLIRSNSLYFKISGVVVGAAALAPLAFACVSYLTRGHFEDDEELLNRSRPGPDLALADSARPVEAAVSSGRYDALTPLKIGFLVACLLIGATLAWRLKPESVGDYLALSIDARTARLRADEVFGHRGLDPRTYLHAEVFHDATDPVTNEFLRQRIGLNQLNFVYANRVPGALWRIRYFRDSQPEEFAVILKPDGSLHSFRHTLAEETAGASLTKEEALSRAEKFIRDEKKIDLSNWNLVEADSDKKPHRVDHTLTWEEKAPLDSAVGASAPGDHAHVRIELQVLGEEVANYRTYVKIPDEWRRNQEHITLARIVLNYSVPILFVFGLALAALIVFLKDLKSEAARAIPWKRIAYWSSWGFAAYAVVFALGNRVARILDVYNTEVSLRLTFGLVAVSSLLVAPLMVGGIALMFGMAWYFATRAFGTEPLLGMARASAAYYRDAFWIGLGGSAGTLGLERLLETLSTHWPTAHRSLAAHFGQDFDAVLPGASISAGSVLSALLATSVVAMVASFVAARVRRRWLRLIVLLIAALALVGGAWGGPSDLAKLYFTRLALLIVLILAVRNILRFNILGCFLAVAATSVVGGAAELLSQPVPFYRANGYALLLMLFLLFGWPWVAWQRRRTAMKTP